MVVKKQQKEVMDELLARIEEASKMSGYKIAQYLEISSQRYYRIKRQNMMSFELLAALMRLDGVDPKKVGGWIEELF